MFDINKLTEAQVEEYIEELACNIDEVKDNKEKTRLLKKISSVRNNMNSFLMNLELVEESIEDDNYSIAGKRLSSEFKVLGRAYNGTKEIIKKLGVEDDRSYLLSTEFKIRGEMSEDILHLILPELLPDKVMNYESGRYDEINKIYTASFTDFFKHGRFNVYNEKAVLCFINYFDSESSLKDHDNFEVKQVIDILTAYILLDDNPKWCSHYMDYKLGDFSHTEIYVVPESKFTYFLKNIII